MAAGCIVRQELQVSNPLQPLDVRAAKQVPQHVHRSITVLPTPPRDDRVPEDTRDARLDLPIREQRSDDVNRVRAAVRARLEHLPAVDDVVDPVAEEEDLQPARPVGREVRETRGGPADDVRGRLDLRDVFVEGCFLEARQVAE